MELKYHTVFEIKWKVHLVPHCHQRWNVEITDLKNYLILAKMSALIEIFAKLLLSNKWVCDSKWPFHTLFWTFCMWFRQCVVQVKYPNSLCNYWQLTKYFTFVFRGKTKHKNVSFYNVSQLINCWKSSQIKTYMRKMT